MEVDPETGKRKSSGGKGSGTPAPAPAPGLDACLLCEEDSDPGAYLFALPMIDEDGDKTEDLMALFDTGPARSVCPSTFRPDVPIEPSEEVPLHQADGTRVAHYGSKFLSMGVGTQKIEGIFEARNVTKPIVAAGQVTDAGQGVRLSGDGGFILDKKSAKKIEKLLGDKERFIELRKQKGVYVILCEDQMPGFFPLIEKESDQRKRMDMSDVMDEEDRPARTKSAPVLPNDKEREKNMKSRMRRFAAGARRAWQDAQQKTPTGVQQKSRRCLWWRWITDLLVATLTQIRLRSWFWHKDLTEQCELAKYFERDPNLMPSTVCFPILTLGAWPKWCSNQTTSLPSRHLSMECGSSAAKGPWWRRGPKYSHQSNGAAENAVRRIESLTRTYVCVLQEKIGYKVDSKSIILPWLVRPCSVCAQQIHQA